MIYCGKKKKGRDCKDTNRNNTHIIKPIPHPLQLHSTNALTTSVAKRFKLKVYSIVLGSKGGGGGVNFA